MNPEELAKIFTYHAPKNGQIEKYEIIRKQALEFAQILNKLCPDSPDKVIAIAKIREAVMWANSSIALE